MGFEPMTNDHPGVKMATAVNAFKFENNGFKPLGRLGLAIIGIRERKSTNELKHTPVR